MSTYVDTSSSDKKAFYAKYGTQEYYFYLALYNDLGYQIFLQRNSMLYLEIDDNIFNPFHSATMIITHDMQVLEKVSKPYVFLGNGRDIVDIEIRQIQSGNFDKDIKNEKIKEFLSLKFQFVVVECNDIIYNNNLCKKLVLVEYSQYMMSENICNIFDIGKSGGNQQNYIETIGGNSVNTLDAINSILATVHQKNDGTKLAKEELYCYDDTGNPIFEGDKDLKVFLNPHGPMSYMEILNYILSFHSYEQSPCVLQFDRYQKKYKLISLKTLCKQNKDHCIETLVFPSQSETMYTVERNIGVNNSPIKWDIFPISTDESRINEFYVSPPTTKYNVMLSGNSAILSNARSFKTMIFDTLTLNSKNFLNNFIELFVNPFKEVFAKNGYDLYPNFYPNPNKKNNYNTYKGYLAPELDQKRFLNQKMKSLLYLNNVYNFKLLGKTHRKSMAFVDVIKFTEDDLNNKPTEWDRNTLGRHFITKVKHIFTFDRYSNEIETIKPYKLVDKSGSGVGEVKRSIENLLKLGGV
jgi:hypothetical protein